MKTLNEIIAELKAENPTLRSGNDEAGYTDLSPADYESTIKDWAENILAKLKAENEANAKETDKAALLAKLGITPDEAQILLT